MLGAKKKGCPFRGTSQLVEKRPDPEGTRQAAKCSIDKYKDSEIPHTPDLQKPPVDYICLRSAQRSPQRCVPVQMLDVSAISITPRSFFPRSSIFVIPSYYRMLLLTREKLGERERVW